MNNPVKLLFGSLVGAGIGVALSKFVERRQEPGLSASLAIAAGDDPGRPSGTSESVTQQGGADLKDRLARARAAGQAARAQKEVELRELFRAKVRRSEALAPSSTDS